jgi:hypothetical protein
MIILQPNQHEEFELIKFQILSNYIVLQKWLLQVGLNTEFCTSYNTCWEARSFICILTAISS